ncbi:ABC transporter ATP-binding protein [Rhodohalobacter sp. SW132]|uniref:ATP-binding cassette domain-containing protein n=1 Tax=Rhodohalobacter sp. SW132 TaxID=2293433 RepID=UPI000E2581F5|nr:ABC transporter ATP-binding protein [Rhodohalobacter sp. SW132]REL24069.1 ABC transporter ATP-binding protein [Rhodohalobacter sp. SW132]
MIELRNVTKQFKAGKTIFESINDTFSAGEFIGLRGPNGSGKTTFLRLLSVNSFPSAGSVFYGEINIHKSPREYLKDVGLVHDQESLPVHMSAVELLEWVLRSRGMWRDDQSPKQINDLYGRLNLGDDRYEQIGTYSTGMKKKTQIAAACIVAPRILILDEPLRGLDTSTRTVVEAILKEMKGEGALILMASHTADIESDYVDRILEFPLKN